MRNFCYVLLFCSISVWATEVPRTVTVTGSGSIISEPDEMSFSISIEQRGMDPKVLEPAVSQIASQVVTLLQDAGVTDTNIQSMQMTLFPQHRYDKGERVTTEYVLGRTIKVTHNDFSVYSALLSEIIEAGATNVSALNTYIKDPEQNYQSALRAAMQNAREKAHKMLATLGAKLGPVESVVEISRVVPKQKNVNVERMEMLDANLNLPGESSTHAQVQVVFSIAK